MVPITITEPAVRSFIFYSSVLGLKVLSMVFLTARQRFKKKVFANPEDVANIKNAVVKYNDEDVERVRRAHLNDLENIPIFWVLGGLYLTTGPSAATAITLFRVYTASRILHTIVYAVKPLPQPSRGLAFGVPLFITLYMGFQVAAHYLSAF